MDRPCSPPGPKLTSTIGILDRLGSAKEVAQIGAAIGREFSYALLFAAISRPTRSWDSGVDHFDRSVVENQVELLTAVTDANRL